MMNHTVGFVYFFAHCSYLAQDGADRRRGKPDKQRYSDAGHVVQHPADEACEY